MSEKDRFGYQGYVATLDEAQRVFERAEGYAASAADHMTSARTR